VDAIERLVYNRRKDTACAREPYLAGLYSVYNAVINATYSKGISVREAAEIICCETKIEDETFHRGEMIAAVIKAADQAEAAGEYAYTHDVYGHQTSSEGPRQDWFGRDYSHE